MAKHSYRNHDLNPEEYCSIRIGKHPRKDKVDKRGRKEFRPGQKKLFEDSRGERRVLLKSPTGSGKSWVLCGLAYEKCLAGEKVLIAVPQKNIGHSFGSKEEEAIALPNGKTMDWVVSNSNDLCNGGLTDAKLKALEKFLVSKPGSRPCDRIMICTHQALALVYTEGCDCSKWKKVNLSVDEAHHSKALEDETDQDTSNRLGNVVKDYCRLKSCKNNQLVLARACFLRGDGAESEFRDWD